MTRTTQLFALQQVDSHGDELFHRVLAINAAIGETESLHGVREAHAAAVAALAAAQKELRAQSHVVDDLSTHLAVQGKRLYDGSIKNAKELVAIEHEIATMKGLRAAKEDLMLEAMDLVDRQQAAHDTAARALAVAETEWQRNQDGLLEEKDGVDTQLKALRAHREKLAQDVPPVDLQLYERLRKAKHGVAVAVMEHDICQACRVKVPGGAAHSAKQGQTLVNCPSCGRLLHPGARGELTRW